MATRISCPNCETPLAVPEEMLGRKVRCKSCQEVFVVRTSPPRNDEDEIDEVERIQTSPRPKPVSSRRRDENDEDRPPRRRDDDDRPVRRRERERPVSSGPPLPLILGGVAAALLLLGGVAVGIWAFSSSNTPNIAGNNADPT